MVGATRTRAIDHDELVGIVGLGVAGNFAGHLEQAGEAGDFVNVAPATARAPKGLFPWFVPGSGDFLERFPLSHDRLALPESEALGDLQIEPEAGVLFAAGYDDDGLLRSLRPYALGAFNDCSIRRPGARRISEKKNWGGDSKGLARRLFPVDEIERDGRTGALRLACFLRRDGETHTYGIDSPLAGYSYYGTTLTDWIIERSRDQRGGPDTPLEDVGALLRTAGRPERLLIGIGATRYTPLGEKTYLRAGDEAVVVVYAPDCGGPDDVADAVGMGREHDLVCASVSVQRVE